MTKKNAPKNPLNDIFADFANIFGGKNQFNMPENIAKLDAAFQRTAASLQSQINQRHLNKGVIVVSYVGIKFPPDTLRNETIEKMDGYARLQEVCKAADFRLDVTFSDSQRLQAVYGADLGGRDCASGYIIVDTDYPYSKSKLTAHVKEAPKSSGAGPKPG
ncbi:MAG: hypothetical protein K8R48_03420 [Alphaproteobacteria bacterium]|nr:hypothetical protein [Alphaproteobacteria bacterium]